MEMTIVTGVAGIGGNRPSLPTLAALRPRAYRAIAGAASGRGPSGHGTAAHLPTTFDPTLDVVPARTR